MPHTPAPKTINRYTMDTLTGLLKGIESAADDRYLVIVGKIEVFEQDGNGGQGESLGTVTFKTDGANVGHWAR